MLLSGALSGCLHHPEVTGKAFKKSTVKLDRHDYAFFFSYRFTQQPKGLTICQ
jgi:hypothetical protein